MVMIRTNSVAQTEQLAQLVATVLKPCDLIILKGDLGAGKTAFVRGLGAALNVDGPVTSPTFALVQTYDGKLPIHHLDVYRLNHLHEAHDLGLSELLDDDAVTVIEWGDRISAVLPQEYLEISIEIGDNPEDRTVTMHLSGRTWQTRANKLNALIETLDTTC